MKLGKRKPSGREKDEASIKELDELRARLYSDNPSSRRKAAFNLSWMQEDGLDILKEALFGERAPRTAKTAAAYGLRSMHGRMMKKAVEVFQEGVQHRSRQTRDICATALARLGLAPAPADQRRARRAKIEIKEVPGKTKKTRRVSPRRKRPGNPSPRRRR
jgi:hypothetical protein